MRPRKRTAGASTLFCWKAREIACPALLSAMAEKNFPTRVPPWTALPIPGNRAISSELVAIRAPSLMPSITPMPSAIFLPVGASSSSAFFAPPV
ncbi:hypothetical protein D3C72_2278610 [compost metagenome]